MVTRETAQKIAGVMDEIEECKQALAILRSKKKCDTPILHVYEDENDEGICIGILRHHAVDIVGRVLEKLCKEYSTLNEKAVKEAKSNEQA